jgi:hypothetical protein
MPTAEEFQAAQDAEYGTYVAIVVISIDGARAFNPGDQVPVSHVESGVVDKSQVAKTNTKAAQAATETES